MKADYQLLLDKIKKQPKLTIKVTKKLKRMRKGMVDKAIHTWHTKAFEKIDCLQCANCCTTTGPRITSTDIDRLAQTMKTKGTDFIANYLRLDEDHDYVFKAMPCPFLSDTNYCNVYDARPKACREYPHTDRVNQLGILSLTKKNAKICPAVAYIVINLSSTL